MNDHTAETVKGYLLRTSQGRSILSPSALVSRHEALAVPEDLVRRLDLRVGDWIEGRRRRGAGGGNDHGGRGPRRGRHGRGQGQPSAAGLDAITAINGAAPNPEHRRPDFPKLRAVAPTRQIHLDAESLAPSHRTIARVIDRFVPLGFGQRALVVAPAKAGKTTVLQGIAAGIAANYPEATLLLLLVDERPEEVTEMETFGVGEVVASSFDAPPTEHLAVADLVLERARRLVEEGKDAVIVLDSLTRLARAYNTVERGSGRTLSGGLDAEAMEKPKRFFGSARAVDPAMGGGSLTIVATALIDTGSKLDQVIFEEFKGTGNSEIVLNRELAERRIWPAIDLNASGTRREELLLSPDELARAQASRKILAGMPLLQGTPMVLEELGRRT